MPELADAKCPQCDGVAEFNVGAQIVKCKHCGFKASYDEYIDAMTDRLTTLTPGYRSQAMGENGEKDE